jgi:phosphate acetyltransferase
MPRTLLVAPAGHHVGLTTVCLGLVRALDRLGARVAFARPIGGRGEDRSAALVRLAARVDPPAPIARAVAEELLSAGDDQTLLEHVVATCARAAEGADVLVVEGMAPEPGIVWASRLNALMLRALDAELVLVAAPHGASPPEIADAIAIAARGFGVADGRVGCVLNKVCAGSAPAGGDGVERVGAACSGCEEDGAAPPIDAYRAALEAERLRPLAVLPCRRDLLAPRVQDLAAALGAKVLHAGDADRRRFQDVALCAMTVPNAIRAFRPGTLVVTPGDRNDIVLATALAVSGGVPLAGLLLTGGLLPDAGVMDLCGDALAAGLPVLAVDAGSYAAANRVAGLDPGIPADDGERVELADIAIQSADSAAAFGIAPRVAMLSYSTGTSGAGEDVEKVKRATELARELRPDLLVDGPLQYDAAIMPDVARAKAPRSPVAGQATVLIFPDLNTGNVTYKAVQRSANVVSMGPMLQGLAKPVNDLSRGCLVEDIVFTVTLTAIQAEQAAARRRLPPAA